VRLPNSRALFVLAIAACGFVAIFSRHIGLPAMLLAILAFLGVELYARFDYQRAARRWLAAASLRPIVLLPPFVGRWRVSSGGPDPRYNHHGSRPDQYFGYDFVREGGDSFDQPIMAPIAGMVTHVESRQPDAPVGTPSHNVKRPLGNYISIQTARGYVILAHLKQGSIVARVGDTVTIGHEIARSGNSGTTRGEHLHVHAQDQPSENPEAAQAVAIAFAANEHADPLLLEFGDSLG
jgi:murein DD-endopeptidase MepM/ murein hydrolase activator NlpD